MPLLGSLLLGQFTALVAFLGLYVTRKVAFAIAAVAAMSGLTLALYILMRTAIAALNTHPLGLGDFSIMIMQIAVPPSAPFCLATYFTIWAGCTVYTWQRDLLHVLIKV